MRILPSILLLCSIAFVAEARVPADNGPAAEGAHLKLVESSYNFGDVPRKGGDLVREFAFVNDGTAPLVLLRVSITCSCLKASFSKKPVAPGATGTIRVTYEPHKSEPGVFNKVVQIFSNSTGGRELITVSGNSIE